MYEFIEWVVCSACRLCDEGRVQVGEYGVYGDLYTVDVYRATEDKNKSLVRWTAPEVLEAQDFSALSPQSDMVGHSHA